MANIYKSKYTGAQVDDAIEKVLKAAPESGNELQKKLKEGTNITIATDGTISATNPTPSVTIAATATDDDVVVLTGSGGTNSVSYDAKHAKKGPASGYTSENTTTSISGSGASGIIKIPQITVDSYGHVTKAEDESVTVTMPTINNSVTDVTFGGTASALTVTDSNLSLVDGLHIRGKMPALGTPYTIKLNSDAALYVRTQKNGTPTHVFSAGMVVEFIYNSSVGGGVWQIWGVDSVADSIYNFVGVKDKASNGQTANGDTYLKLYENGGKQSQFNIKGTGAATVTSDANGNITINSTGGDSYSVVEITTSQTTLTDEEYNTLTASPFNKIKCNNIVYDLYQETTSELVYTANYFYNGSRITITKSTKGITRGTLSSLISISSYVKNSLDYNESNTTYALSAYQGKVLNNRLTAVENSSGGGTDKGFDNLSALTIAASQYASPQSAAGSFFFKGSGTASWKDGSAATSIPEIAVQLGCEPGNGIIFNAVGEGAGASCKIEMRDITVLDWGAYDTFPVSGTLSDEEAVLIERHTFSFITFRDPAGWNNAQDLYVYCFPVDNAPGHGGITYKSITTQGNTYTVVINIERTSGGAFQSKSYTITKTATSGALEARLTALEARVTALEAGRSELYTISGSTDGKYYNLTAYDDFRDYCGQLSSLTLSNSTGTNFDINCGNRGNGVIITYGSQQSGGAESGHTTNYLNLGTNPIKITAINIEFTDSYISNAEHYGINLNTRKAEIRADVLTKMPKLFSKTSS